MSHPTPFTLLYEAHMKTLEELRLAKGRLAALAEQQKTIIAVQADQLRAQIAGQVLSAIVNGRMVGNSSYGIEHLATYSDELVGLASGLADKLLKQLRGN